VVIESCPEPQLQHHPLCFPIGVKLTCFQFLTSYIAEIFSPETLKTSSMMPVARPIPKTLLVSWGVYTKPSPKVSGQLLNLRDTAKLIWRLPPHHKMKEGVAVSTINSQIPEAWFSINTPLFELIQDGNYITVPKGIAKHPCNFVVLLWIRFSVRSASNRARHLSEGNELATLICRQKHFCLTQKIDKYELIVKVAIRCESQRNCDPAERLFSAKNILRFEKLLKPKYGPIQNSQGK
jgi:hypothetical protein